MNKMMKKRLILSLVAVVAAMGTFAQSALVATLSHGTNLSTYYGDNAFVEAYNAAEDGDCITLSAGTFKTIATIEKAITVRGAGPEVGGTAFGNAFNITINEKRSYPLVLEGLRLTTTPPVIRGASTQEIQFLKVYASSGAASITLYGCATTFMHCVLKGGVNATSSGSTAIHAYFYNSVIAGAYMSSDANHDGHFQNCILTSYVSALNNSELKNCIILSYQANFHSNPLPNTSTAKNCVGTDLKASSGTNYFSNVGNDTNQMLPGENAGVSALFKELQGIYTATGGGYYLEETVCNFELTDEAKATYKGDDGTEVGIYGGANPFTTAVSSPRISNFNIVTNTEGGQLKVKLNVE